MDRSKDPKEWIRRAKSNLVKSKITKTEDMLYEDLCFDLQQSAEKALKGLIIRLGLTAPRTHSLHELLDIIRTRMIVPDEMRRVMFLNNYAVSTRYPGDYTEITEEEYKEALEVAEMVYNWVVENIK